jgi:hypothetical protein
METRAGLSKKASIENLGDGEVKQGDDLTSAEQGVRRGRSSARSRSEGAGRWEWDEKET